MKKYIAELIGTFALVFVGTGSIIVEQQTGSVSLVGIALAFGLIITAMIYTFGSISGCHINPAVTISLVIGKKISIKDSLYYILFQILGAILASLSLHILFPENILLGSTNPSGSITQSFIMEVVLTFFMMLTILGTKENAGLIIGFVVIALIFIGGPISGGSFNPARSIGPALVSGEMENLWMYLIAPTIGAVLATFTWRIFETETV